MNIQAVADAAGVSKTTVSHVLSGKRPVSAATRRKVEKVMEDLGYRPNFFAQALNSKRSHSLALLVENITNPFYPALARGLQTAVAGAGQVVMLFDADAGTALTHTFIEEMIQRHVDGVVVAAPVSGADLATLRSAQIPVVVVGSGQSAEPVDWVSADDARIARDAVGYLHMRGHRRVAAISGPAGAEPGADRLAGYRAAVAALELADDAEIVEADWTRLGGKAAMEEILQGEQRPTAVFCANDLMAIGALDALFEAGLRTPDDIAIVGVDDIDAAGLVRPGLTTVRVPAEEIGRAAGDMLLRRMTDPDAPIRHVLVQHTLIPRQSA